MGMTSRIARRIAAAAGVILVGIVGIYVVAQKFRKARSPKDDLASEQVARDESIAPIVDPAPLPPPAALPIAGGEGTLPDGYPVAHADGAGFRSLLVNRRFDELDRYFDELQNDYEADNKRETWVDGAADAFGSPEPSLEPMLDAWVAATPNHFAPYLARADYWTAVGASRRGDVAEPPDASTPAHDAFQHAAADLSKALGIKTRLVSAMRLRIRALDPSKTREVRAQVDRATAMCPGCFDVRLEYLLATRPRWGGTYDAMHAFAATCDANVNPRCKALDGVPDYDLADLAWRDKRPDEARQDIDRAVAAGDCATFLAARARMRLDTKEADGALADAQKAVTLSYAGDTLSVLSEAYYALSRYEPAVQTLLATLRLGRSDSHAKDVAARAVKALASEAWDDARADRRDDALRKLNLAAQLAPSTREIVAERGQIAFAAARAQAARAQGAAPAH